MFQLVATQLKLQNTDIKESIELTHDRDVVLDQQRGFLPALLQDAHGLWQGAAMETNPVDA